MREGGGGELRGISQWVQLFTWSPNKLKRSYSILKPGTGSRYGYTHCLYPWEVFFETESSEKRTKNLKFFVIGCFFSIKYSDPDLAQPRMYPDSEFRMDPDPPNALPVARPPYPRGPACPCRWASACWPAGAGTSHTRGTASGSPCSLHHRIT